MDTDFYNTAFSVLVTLQAVLFGVFGVLFSVYTNYMAKITEKTDDSIPMPPPVCFSISKFCRFIHILGWLITCTVIFTLCNMQLKYLSQYVIAFLIVVIMVIMAGMVYVFAKKMRLRDVDK